MNILVACEESQTVTIELRKLGYDAFSCDIIEESGGHPEWHIKDNVLNHINKGWDLIIAHPPCTYLSNSGVSWLYKKPGRWDQMKAAALFFKKIQSANCEYIAIENPIMHKYAVNLIGGRQSQLIQPYQFGHAERKATCLWLKELPDLRHTSDLKDKMDALPKKESQRILYLPPSKDRQALRSKTFIGIAKAMASQWPSFILNSSKIKC